MQVPGLDACVHRQTSFGSHVYVLNTGAVISAEGVAMLQALHSRSLGGLKAHLEKLAKKGPQEFMGSHYIGYGHKSIGDCGTDTEFIEGISMLAAKAIQDWFAYRGQEGSSRYMDFSLQAFLDVTGTAVGRDIQEAWRAFYLSLQGPVRDHLRAQFPCQPGEDEKVWAKAIDARAFDITRAFLPAGATTNISWHTDLRQASDKLALLRHHVLPEIAELGIAMEDAFREWCPSSFSHKRYPETETYNAWWMREKYYYHDRYCPDFALTKNDIHAGDLEEHRDILQRRPAKTELPRFLDECGRMQFNFTLDFGSYRDIQRHRAVTQRMPLLTEELGFHPWYLAELPDTQRERALQFLQIQRKRIDELGLSRELRQYYIPMGYLVANRLTGATPQLVYLVELRATRFVHPTLRIRATQMAEVLMHELGNSGLVLHLDPDPGRFDIRRGTHDIIEK